MVSYLDNKQEEVLPIANNSVTVFKYDGENLKLEKYDDISFNQEPLKDFFFCRP